MLMSSFAMAGSRLAAAALLACASLTACSSDSPADEPEASTTTRPDSIQSTRSNPCRVFPLESVADLTGLKLEPASERPAATCDYLDGADNERRVRFALYDDSRESDFVSLSTGGEAVTMPSADAVATFMPPLVAGTARLLTWHDPFLFEIEAPSTGSAATDQELVVGLADLVVGLLPNVPAVTSGEGGSTVADLCEQVTDDEAAEVLGEGSSRSPQHPAGSCRITSADGLSWVTGSVAVASGATADQIDGAQIANQVGEAEPVKWSRIAQEVGDAAVYQGNPDRAGLQGQLLVLDGDRIISIDVSLNDGSEADAAELGARAAEAFLS